MDLKKFQQAFDTMSYDKKSTAEIILGDICSTFIITESADLQTASDFIAAYLESKNGNIIGTILVQESVSKVFLDFLNNKLKAGTAHEAVKKLSGSGFEVIGHIIVKCPRSMIPQDAQFVVALEVFRTTKEAISLSKTATSIALWCEKLSISLEYVNALNACQIWLNSAFGMTNPKIPFLSSGNEVVCDENLQKSIANGSHKSPLFDVSSNVQFQTIFHGEGKFKTVVIPFGETFAN